MTSFLTWMVWIRVTVTCRKWRNLTMKMLMMTKTLVGLHIVLWKNINRKLMRIFAEDSYASRNGSGIKITPNVRKTSAKMLIAQSLPMAVPIFNHHNEDDYEEVSRYYNWPQSQCLIDLIFFQTVSGATRQRRHRCQYQGLSSKRAWWFDFRWFTQTTIQHSNLVHPKSLSAHCVAKSI